MNDQQRLENLMLQHFKPWGFVASHTFVTVEFQNVGFVR